MSLLDTIKELSKSLTDAERSQLKASAVGLYREIAEATRASREPRTQSHVETDPSKVELEIVKRDRDEWKARALEYESAARNVAAGYHIVSDRLDRIRTITDEKS